ncbi:hypothetical protein PILCRDRAFT_792296 [Piloderma croceum F 1598]|uniref:Nephrocystin 3-like N-terminal domain-containing protein n=1 Tax=Piloderma croceum (strain F 1598) TaxID=765440 RepID=A0A0C3F342_PILCF|nr:hypothetical protein PILCRDRAFT_792296 [Piloderma croceum F 1598]
MFIGSIDKLNHEMTSYKTRHSSYGNPTGCMAGTRVKILTDLETWASNDLSSKVYWLVGMAGTGKSTISQTLCEILDGKNMLGASFFCSRGSENARNARLIVPTIAHSLASTSPCIKSEVVKAIENDPKLAEPTYINLVDQFNKLIHDPIQVSVGNAVKTYKIIVIDAVDECTDLRLVSPLIQLILKSASAIPLKVFIASRDEPLIHHAFTSLPRLQTAFYLHEADKDVVKGDIRMYLETSLAEIKAHHGHTSDTWPPQSEISALLDRSGTLFIYAATAIRYISQGGPLYKSRLSTMANRDMKSVSKLQTSTIDGLYEHILDQACESKEESEVIPMRQLVSMIVFLRNPLPIQPISSLSEIDAHLYLSQLTSVIHVPTHKEAAVAPFHASFPDFVTDPTRYSRKRYPPFCALVASEGHEMLAIKCLKQMNRSLKYNICEVPKESTVSRRETTNSPDNNGKISEALKYSCLYWASHFFEAQLSRVDLIDALDTFLHKHLLHWIECLSALGELQTGILSLRSAATALSRFKPTNIRCHDLQLLVDDGRQCLQMNFESIQKHSFEIYESALVWIPKKSLTRKVYATNVRRVPRVILGLFDLWGSTELYMQNGSPVNSVAFAQDGSRVVSGSGDNTVRIWNTMTGEVEAELKGHTNSVRSVAFAQDGSRVVSGSDDKTVWNAMTGEVEAELRGHTDWVMSVAFAQDGSRVVSGSDDNTVRIWNTTTGEVEAELKGHTNSVTSVAFAQDGSRVVSGSDDNTVRIWNATTGEVEAELKGHTSWVRSVAFAQDGSRVVSGSYDETVRIWNTVTGESQVMTMTTITLPDASVVHYAGKGNFCISYPEQPTLSIHAPLSISDDCQWIVGALHDCWIPSHNRDFISSSFSGDRVCFGYHSGDVIIFDMKAVP